MKDSDIPNDALPCMTPGYVDPCWDCPLQDGCRFDITREENV